MSDSPLTDEDAWRDCAAAWRDKFEEAENRAGVAEDDNVRLRARIAELEQQLP